MARVLVIDDDEVIRMLLTRVLEAGGHEVDVAPDGLKGMALFKSRPADVVITDIYMPNQEGLATIMELRRSAPTVKIIAMSGGGSRADMDVLPVAEALGAERTLRKPFTPADVNALMADLPTA
jgi:CheY-like chemotaxis protein